MKKLKPALFTTLFLLLIFSSCEPKKTPVDYYNSAVGRYNLSSSFFLRMQQAINDRELGEYTDYDLENSLESPALFAEAEVKKLEKLKGNEASDNLIQAAIESAQYDYELATSKELKAIFKIIDDSATIEALQENLEPHTDYLDTILAKHDIIFENLDAEIIKYADANNIKVE